VSGSVRYQPPAADELEVSIFGPGKGECIVVHVPNGPWLVVDSFVVGSAPSYVPVSVEYLRRVGVTDVAGIFITHWHDDHTRGAAEVIREFSPSLKFVGLPCGVGDRELASFLYDLLPDARRFSLVKDLAAVISVLNRPELSHVQPILLTAGVTLPIDGQSQLRALSPSLEDARQQCASLLTYLPGWTGPRPRRYDVNSGCAVLLLNSGSLSVVLYSDLDIGETDSRGLRCVVKNYGNILQAQVIKIGHHGSETAYHPPALTAGRADLAAGAITPFPARGEHLPRGRQVDRYKKALRQLHLTALPGRPAQTAGKVALKHTPFSQYTKVIGRHLDAIGHVRYRVRPSDSNVRVELFARSVAA
jgi:hypothetical protein